MSETTANETTTPVTPPPPVLFTREERASVSYTNNINSYLSVSVYQSCNSQNNMGGLYVRLGMIVDNKEHSMYINEADFNSLRYALSNISFLVEALPACNND